MTLLVLVRLKGFSRARLLRYRASFFPVRIADRP